MPLCYDFSVAFYGVFCETESSNFIHPRPFSMVLWASSSCTLARRTRPVFDGEMIVKYYKVVPPR